MHWPHYGAPRWLPGGHAQTIWPALVTPRPPPPAYRRERWDTPDRDFVDVDLLDGSTADAPMLVLFHGLEGSSASHYSVAFARVAAERGWAFAVPHFRGCSGELNLAPRSYHSGDFEEIGWILARLRAGRSQPLKVAGVSLGGNALLRWAEENGAGAAQTAGAIAAISAPVDLAAAGHAIERGFNRISYLRMFLATLKPKALAKLRQHPKLADAARIRSARTLYEFDDAYTAPVHGYRGVEDYWARASAKPHLHAIRVPTLVLNATNDPFVPGASLPRGTVPGGWVTLAQPRHGGHVGFPGGRFPGHLETMPQAVVRWLAEAG